MNPDEQVVYICAVKQVLGQDNFISNIVIESLNKHLDEIDIYLLKILFKDILKYQEMHRNLPDNWVSLKDNVLNKIYFMSN